MFNTIFWLFSLNQKTGSRLEFRFRANLFQCFSIFSRFRFKNKMWTANVTMQADTWPIGIMVFYIFLAYKLVVLEFVWFQKSSHTHSSFKCSFAQLILHWFERNEFNTDARTKIWVKSNIIWVKYIYLAKFAGGFFSNYLLNP